MAKKQHNDDLTHNERVLNKWTGERRRKQEERYHKRRPEDPDEDTIYNVLCPRIRAGWVSRVEHEHRVTECQPVEIVEISASVLLGDYDHSHRSNTHYTFADLI